MFAVLAPGQGSQKPGFLSPWLALPGAEAKLREWSALARLDLVRLGTVADAEEIKDTAKTQPLLVAAALLAAEQLPMDTVGLVAGHSIGELAAAAMAGVLTPEAAISLASARGREMAAACAAEPTGMAAVLGGDAEEVIATIEAAKLYPANRNGAGQVVAAGALGNIKAFQDSPPPNAKVIALPVAGAFHTPFMAQAESMLDIIARDITVADATKTLLSNRDGEPVREGRDILSRLVQQVTSPVRWDLCMARMAELGVTTVIELPPAGTLVGLAKRGLKGVKTIAIKTPDDLPAVRETLTNS